MLRSESAYAVVAILVFVASPSPAKEYFVRTNGNDQAKGSKNEPFRTIQKAANAMKAGDTCTIAPGRYEETVTLRNSGTGPQPIRFIAAKGGKVVITGTQKVTSPWQRHRGQVWKTQWKGPQIQQLFVDGMMQHEARWPNMPFEKRWIRPHWKRSGKDSAYGKVEAKGMGVTDVDWTGGIAMLNVGHQFFTWTRDIKSHSKGPDIFTYEQDLPGLAFLDLKDGLIAQGKDTPWLRGQWLDDYVFVFGKLEGLDAPTEWFHDPAAGVLYYMPKKSEQPRDVEVKARDYGLMGKGINHVQFEGIRFHACAFRLTNCSHLLMRNCHVDYPNYRRRILISEQEKYKGTYPQAMLPGKNNRMKRCSIRYAGGNALTVSGQENLVENCIISDGCWSGTLHYSLVKLSGTQNVFRRNTVSMSGAPLIQHGGDNLIEFNHFHDAGLLSEDIAAIYTAGGNDGERAREATVRYNWVHGVQTGHGRGLGIRGDDMTRGHIVHHNVVWDCGMAGIIIKGGENRVFNNTIFDVTNGDKKKVQANKGGLIIPTQPEPRKAWKEYHKMGIYLEHFRFN